MTDSRVTPEQASAAMKSIDDELEGVNTVDPRYARHTLRCFITQQQPAAAPHESGGQGDAPSIAAAEAMGAKGAPPNEAERLAFEAWMRGHCWAMCATWDGRQYVSDDEHTYGFDRSAARTRGLWAAWRDRAALTDRADEGKGNG